jgi:hypothetical protein
MLEKASLALACPYSPVQLYRSITPGLGVKKWTIRAAGATAKHVILRRPPKAASKDLPMGLASFEARFARTSG